MAVQDLPRQSTGVMCAVTVNRPRHEVYAYWRDFTNLPRFMRHLESVEVIDHRRSHWIAKAPVSTRIEWDAEITMDEPDTHIAWRSMGESEVDNSGSVHFQDAPGDRGTEVIVDLNYDTPSGTIGKVIAKLIREEPDRQVREDMRRFKSLLETGVVPTIFGQPTGNGRYTDDE